MFGFLSGSGIVKSIENIATEFIDNEEGDF